jgi:hypothetical protein
MCGCESYDVVRWNVPRVLVTRENYRAFALLQEMECKEDLFYSRDRKQCCFSLKQQLLCKRREGILLV